MKSKTLFFTSFLAAAAMSTVPAKAASTLIWAGGESGTWNTTTTNKVWKIFNTTTTTAFTAGDNAGFSSNANITVTIGESITAGRLDVYNGATVTLAGNATNKVTTTGGTVIFNGSTLKYGGTGVLAGTVVVGSGGTLDMNGYADSSGMNGLGTITLAGGTLTNTGKSDDCSDQQIYSLAVNSYDSTIGGTGDFGLIRDYYKETTINLAGTDTSGNAKSFTLTKTGSNTFWLVNTTISGSGGTLDVSEGAVSGRPKLELSDKGVRLGEGVTLKTSDTGKADLTIESMGANSNLVLGSSVKSTITLTGDVDNTATLIIANGDVTWTHNNADKSTAATIGIAAGSSFKDNSDYKHTLELSGALSGAGTLISGVATTASQGDGDRRTVTLSGSTKNFTGTWELETASSTDTSGNRRVNGILNSSDSVFGGVISFTNSSASTSKTSSKLSLAKDMEIGGLKGTLSNTTVQSSDSTARALTINTADGASYVYAGTIASTISSLTKTGAGTQTLSGDNSNFSSAVNVSEGTLIAGSANALGTGAVSVAENATLALGAGSVSSGTLSGAGTISLASGTSASTLTVNQTADTEFTGTIGGAVSLVKVGAKSLTLSGTNSYTGGTTISAGTLVAGSANALGTGAVSVAKNATLALGAGSVSSGTLTGAGTISLASGTSASTLTVNQTATSAEFSGTLGAGVTLVKSGKETALTLSGNTSSSSANVSLDAGTLNLSSASTLGSLTTTKNAGDAVLNISAKTNLTNLRVWAGTANVSGVVNISGNVNSTDASKPSFFLANWTSGTLNVNSGGVVNVLNACLSVRDSTGYINVSGGEANFAKSLGVLAEWGSAVVTLNSGSLNIGDGGISFSKTKSGSAGTLTVALNGGTVGSLADAWSTSQAMTLGGNVVFDTTKKTVNENGTATSTSAGSTITLAGAISDASGKTGSLTKTGAGTLKLSGANSFTGDVKISAGTLQAGSTSALGTGTVYVEKNTTLALGTDSVSVGGLSGAGTVSLATDTSASTLTVASATDKEFAGTIGTGISLVKQGAGTLKLSGANRLTGGVTINEGAIEATNASALGSTGTTTVNNGGVLKISVADGVNAGTGAVKFSSGAKFAIDLTAYSSGVEVDKALTVITASAISFNSYNDLGTVTVPTSEQIENYFSAKDSNLGDFSSYARKWNYADGKLTLTLTTVPEPSMFGLLAGAGALAFVAARRRRRCAK